MHRNAPRFKSNILWKTDVKIAVAKNAQIVLPIYILSCEILQNAGGKQNLNVFIQQQTLLLLLNSMPMGFYQPAQIVIDAKKHGVEVRPVDVNYSTWDNLLEEKPGKYCALHLGFRQVRD